MPSTVPVAAVYKMPRLMDQADAALDWRQGSSVRSGREWWRVEYEERAGDGSRNDPGSIDQFAVASISNPPVDPNTSVQLPRVGDQADTGDGSILVVQRVQPQRLPANPFVWDVQIEIAELKTPSVPFNITIDTGQQPWEQQAWKDRLGLPLVNTVGDYVSQLPNNQFSDQTVSIRYQYCGGSVSTSADLPNIYALEGCQDKVNNGTISAQICGRRIFWNARQAKLVAHPIRSEKQVIGRNPTTSNAIYQYLHSVEMQFLVRNDTFKFKAPNEGYRGYPLSASYDDYFVKKAGRNYQGTADGFVAFTDNTGAIRPQPTRLGSNSVEIDLTAVSGSNSVYWLPDVLADNQTGRFELEDQVDFSGLFTDLGDTN